MSRRKSVSILIGGAVACLIIVVAYSTVRHAISEHQIFRALVREHPGRTVELHEWKRQNGTPFSCGNFDLAHRSRTFTVEHDRSPPQVQTYDFYESVALPAVSDATYTRARALNDALDDCKKSLAGRAVVRMVQEGLRAPEGDIALFSLAGQKLAIPAGNVVGKTRKSAAEFFFATHVVSLRGLGTEWAPAHWAAQQPLGFGEKMTATVRSPPVGASLAYARLIQLRDANQIASPGSRSVQGVFVDADGARTTYCSRDDATRNGYCNMLFVDQNLLYDVTFGAAYAPRRNEIAANLTRLMDTWRAAAKPIQVPVG